MIFPLRDVNYTLAGTPPNNRRTKMRKFNQRFRQPRVGAYRENYR